MKLLFRLIVLMGVIMTASHGIFAQIDSPAEREDAALERERLLRASDQIEVLTSLTERLQKDLLFLKKRIEELETENRQLNEKIDAQSKVLVKEQELQKKALLKEVSTIMEENFKKNAVASSKSIVNKPMPEKQDNSSESNKASTSNAKGRGYEHVVESGQNLWAIAKAYQDEGIEVSVDDIRKANGLTSESVLKIGQKLFIPIK